MHTRKALRIKLIFAVLLPVAFNAVSLFFADIIYQLAAFFVCALLFLVPFYATVFYIRQYRPSSLKGYFVSDILDDDIVCTMGADNQKLLLFDDFKCFDEGTYMGQVSKEVIAQMPKEN